MDNAFFYVVSLILITKLAEIHASEKDCPNIYKRYTKNHSYCKPKNSSCKILRSLLTQKEIDQILSLHNSFRSIVATQQQQSSDLPTAADMLQMEWDPELSAVAQNYADQCIYAHDKPNSRRVRNFGVGQNIAIQRLTGNNLSPPQSDWAFAVGDWFEEIVYFYQNMICPFPNLKGGGEYRHFSELIWARSFRVGCGYTMYKQGKTYTRLYICNYGPTGNIYDTCVYTAGAPCSQCPENTCCGDDCDGGPSLPGLCKRTNDQAPIASVAVPTLFQCDFSDPTKEDCLTNIKGQDKWYIIPALGGNYLETVLNGGEKSTIVFSKPIIPNSEAFCLQLKYRKGPNLDGNPESSTAEAVVIIPSMNDYTYTQSLPSYENPARQQFSTYNLTLQWGKETELKISFDVPQGAYPQFFDISSILAVDDACQD